MHPLDPALLRRADVRAALAARDVSAVYRLLRQSGVSPRRIAQLTGQSSSEVREILEGRQVYDVWVLERIADGLGVPRAWLGVGYGKERPDAPSAETDTDEDITRMPLPSRLDISDVHAVQALTERLVSLTRYFGGQAGLVGAVVKVYTRWMAVPATEAIKAQFDAALAELHTLAGWCCYDDGVDGTGYFTRALRLASEAADAYGIANAAWTSGATLVRNGYPGDALKLFQLGQLHLDGFQPGRATPLTVPSDDPRLPTLIARLQLNSATAYALMGNPDQATRCLAEAHDGWEPRDAFERGGMDRATAGIHLDLGQLEAAEQFAASALRSYSEDHRRGRILAELLLAEVHIRAGEPHGLTLARHAINEMRTLQSAAARRERLTPLAAALEARPGTDTQELARIARQVAATRI